MPGGRFVSITFAGNGFPQLLESTELFFPRHLLNFCGGHRARSLFGNGYSGKAEIEETKRRQAFSDNANLLIQQTIQRSSVQSIIGATEIRRSIAFSDVRSVIFIGSHRLASLL